MREAAERRLMQGAEVFILPMPRLGSDDKAGADDFVKQRGIAEFRKLLKEAKPSEEFVSWGKDGVNLDLCLDPVPRDWFTDLPPKIEWLWEGLLPLKRVALLIGEGNVGKTFFNLRLAYAVATGRPFLGRATRQGKVVLLSCEEDMDELRRRLYAVHAAETRDAKPSEQKALLDALTENLIPVSVVGQELYLVTADKDGIKQGRALDYLIHKIKRVGDVVLVSIDPLSRIHNLPNENEALWGTSIVNACERIAQEVGCAVELSHHTGKKKEQQKGLAGYDSRGTSALPDAARVCFNLRRVEPAECKNMSNVDAEEAASGRVLSLRHTKAFGGPVQPPTWIYRSEDGVLVPFTPIFDDSSTPMDGALMLALRRWWEARGCKPMYRTTVRSKYREIFGEGVSRKKATKLFDSAIEDGTLIEVASSKNGGVSYAFRSAQNADAEEEE